MFKNKKSEEKKNIEDKKKEEKKPEKTEDLINKKQKTKEEENLEGWKRCQADFENYRKRQDERMKELGVLFKEDMAMQIFPVLDNFQASIEHIPEDQKKSAWVEGMFHIQRQLENVLKDNGIEEIETKEGDDFNPEIHEAVVNHETHNMDHGTKKDIENKIAKIVSRGYKIGDKVIRAVKVIVE